MKENTFKFLEARVNVSELTSLIQYQSLFLIRKFIKYQVFFVFMKDVLNRLAVYCYFGASSLHLLQGNHATKSLKVFRPQVCLPIRSRLVHLKNFRACSGLPGCY